MDNSIYQFNILNLNIPIKQFTAESFTCSSFYIRNSISPDGRFLCSGSMNADLHLWEIDGPLTEPILFQSHSNEVTGVCWSPQFNQIASCSDDRSLKIWRLLEDPKEMKSDSNGIQNFKIIKGSLPRREVNDENKAPTSNAQTSKTVSTASVSPTAPSNSSTSSVLTRNNQPKPRKKSNPTNTKSTQRKCITDYFQAPSKEL